MICPHCDIYWGDEPHTKPKYCEDCQKLINRAIWKLAQSMVCIDNEPTMKDIDRAIANEDVGKVQAALRSLLGEDES